MKTVMTWLNFVLSILGFFVLISFLMNDTISKDVFSTALLMWLYILLNTVTLLKDEL